MADGPLSAGPLPEGYRMRVHKFTGDCLIVTAGPQGGSP